MSPPSTPITRFAWIKGFRERINSPLIDSTFLILFEFALGIFVILLPLMAGIDWAYFWRPMPLPKGSLMPLGVVLIVELAGALIVFHAVNAWKKRRWALILESIIAFIFLVFLIFDGLESIQRVHPNPVPAQDQLMNFMFWIGKVIICIATIVEGIRKIKNRIPDEPILDRPI